MPTGSAMALAMMSDISVSSSVGSARSASADSTGLFMKMDCPRSPWTSLPSQPRTARRRAVQSELRAQRVDILLAGLGPSMTAAGSPGVMRMITNTMVATMNITATSPTSRFKR